MFDVKKLATKFVQIIFVLGLFVVLHSFYSHNYSVVKHQYLFQVIDIQKTKVITITFKEVNTPTTYVINYIESKCPSWNTIKIGSQWSLPVYTDKAQNRFIVDANKICGETYE